MSDDLRGIVVAERPTVRVPTWPDDPDLEMWGASAYTHRPVRVGDSLDGVTCPDCGGKGWLPGPWSGWRDEFEDCPTCDGIGLFRTDQVLAVEDRTRVRDNGQPSFIILARWEPQR